MKEHCYILAIATALSGPCAADAPASVDATGFVKFRDIDSDRNGYVSRVEARSVTAVENAFDSADVDSNGLLDRAEYASVRLAREAE